MAEKTVRDFVQSIGVDALGSAVKVKTRMIQHAAREGVMPASWYAEAERLAREKGQPLPSKEMFSFKGKR